MTRRDNAPSTELEQALDRLERSDTQCAQLRHRAEEAERELADIDKLIVPHQREIMGWHCDGLEDRTSCLRRLIRERDTCKAFLRSIPFKT